MARVLLSPVVGPHGESSVLFNIASDRLTRGQDIFTMHSHNHFDSLHFIAANLESPTTVLEHPTMEDVEEELAQGYDFIGINFTLAHLPRAFQMCERIKKVSPKTQIILGGYGTICFNTILPENPSILKNVDHVCHGEGVRFLRRLLDEDVDAPYHQPVGPLTGATMPWLAPFPAGSTGTIVSGLGCPNMCDFCSTSHYYHGEFIELFTARGIYRGMLEVAKANPRLRQITIFDENLYKDREKVLEVGKLIRDDPDLGLARLAFFGFGTVEDLSTFDIEELALAGAGSVWIGVESMYSNLPKRQGKDVTAVFADLHAHGISTIGSWIAGWDFHTPENIHGDFDQFVRLRPTQSQLLPLTPIPGTKLWEKKVGANFSMAQRYFGRSDGSDPEGTFTQEELWSICEQGHVKLYEHAGPTVIRHLRVGLNGYEYCKASSNEHLNTAKAAYHRETVMGLYHFLKPAEYFAPNDHVRDEVRELAARYREVMGEPTPAQKAMERYAFLKATHAKINFAFGDKFVREEPYRLYRYRQGGKLQDGLPYTVSYPRTDWHFEREMHRAQAEHTYVEKLIERVTGADSPEEVDRILADVFGDLEAHADVALRLAGAEWANTTGLEAGVIALREMLSPTATGRPPSARPSSQLPGLRMNLTT